MYSGQCTNTLKLLPCTHTTLWPSQTGWNNNDNPPFTLTYLKMISVPWFQNKPYFTFDFDFLWIIMIQHAKNTTKNSFMAGWTSWTDRETALQWGQLKSRQTFPEYKEIISQKIQTKISEQYSKNPHKWLHTSKWQSHKTPPIEGQWMQLAVTSCASVLQEDDNDWVG